MDVRVKINSVIRYRLGLKKRLQQKSQVKLLLLQELPSENTKEELTGDCVRQKS